MDQTVRLDDLALEDRDRLVSVVRFDANPAGSSSSKSFRSRACSRRVLTWASAHCTAMDTPSLSWVPNHFSIWTRLRLLSGNPTSPVCWAKRSEMSRSSPA